MKGDNIHRCCVFGKVFIKPLRNIMKMADDGLFHNVLTELVFFEKVAQLSKHIHSSSFSSASPMLNFLFEIVMLLFTARMLNDSPCNDKFKSFIFSEIQDEYSSYVNQSGPIQLVESSCFLSVGNKYTSFRNIYKRVRTFPRDNHLTFE